jgi:hypothetical protein
MNELKSVALSIYIRTLLSITTGTMFVKTTKAIEVMAFLSKEFPERFETPLDNIQDVSAAILEELFPFVKSLPDPLPPLDDLERQYGEYVTAKFYSTGASFDE